MNNVNFFLIDWSIRFLENKDSIKKDIIKIEKSKKDFDFIVYYKDKVRYFIIVSMLDNNIFNRIKSNDNVGIITLNNMANIRFVVSNWKELIEFKFLNIFFINPFSSWIQCGQ